MQLELFPRESISDAERARVFADIRREYWFIRNLRPGRFGQAALRRHYRRVAEHKKRLLLAGVEKREILDFLACCRLKCKGKKPPFQGCPHCA